MALMPEFKIPPVLEDVVHLQVCNHIRSYYPDAIFNSDGAGNNLTSKAQRGKASMLKSARGYPDLFIAEPRGDYHGLFLELKSAKYSPYLKNGNLSTTDHIQEQAEMLQGLLRKGYYANFAVGTDEAVRFIDWYMKLPKWSSQERAQFQERTAQLLH